MLFIQGVKNESNINSFYASNALGLPSYGVADMKANNTFTITLTPIQALQTKRGYELEGYQVNMIEVHKASHIDNTFKYHFTLSGGGVVVIPNNNNLLEVA